MTKVWKQLHLKFSRAVLTLLFDLGGHYQFLRVVLAATDNDRPNTIAKLKPQKRVIS